MDTPKNELYCKLWFPAYRGSRSSSSCSADLTTGILCFVPSGSENLTLVANRLYGKRVPTARLGVRLK